MQSREDLSLTLEQLSTEQEILAKLLHRNNNQHRKSKPHLLMKTVLRYVRIIDSQSDYILDLNKDMEAALRSHHKLTGAAVSDSTRRVIALHKIVAVSTQAITWIQRAAIETGGYIAQMVFLPLYTVYLALAARLLGLVSALAAHHFRWLELLSSSLKTASRMFPQHHQAISCALHAYSLPQAVTDVVESLFLTTVGNSTSSVSAGGGNGSDTVSSSLEDTVKKFFTTVVTPSRAAIGMRDSSTITPSHSPLHPCEQASSSLESNHHRIERNTGQQKQVDMSPRHRVSCDVGEVISFEQRSHSSTSDKATTEVSKRERHAVILNVTSSLSNKVSSSNVAAAVFSHSSSRSKKLSQQMTTVDDKSEQKQSAGRGGSEVAENTRGDLRLDTKKRKHPTASCSSSPAPLPLPLPRPSSASASSSPLLLFPNQRKKCETLVVDQKLKPDVEATSRQISNNHNSSKSKKRKKKEKESAPDEIDDIFGSLPF